MHITLVCILIISFVKQYFYTQCKHKLSKKPKRVLQFSDGVLEEYSSEDEVDAPKPEKSVAQIDTVIKLHTIIF